MQDYIPPSCKCKCWTSSLCRLRLLNLNQSLVILYIFSGYCSVLFCLVLVCSSILTWHPCFRKNAPGPDMHNQYTYCTEKTRCWCLPFFIIWIAVSWRSLEDCFWLRGPIQCLPSWDRCPLRAIAFSECLWIYAPCVNNPWMFSFNFRCLQSLVGGFCQVFQGLDTDGSGTLTRQELADVPVPWSGRLLLKRWRNSYFLRWYFDFWCSFVWDELTEMLQKKVLANLDHSREASQHGKNIGLWPAECWQSWVRSHQMK